MTEAWGVGVKVVIVDANNIGSQAPSQAYLLNLTLGCSLAFGVVTSSQGILVSGQGWGLLLRKQPPAVGGALRSPPSQPRVWCFLLGRLRSREG